MSPVQAVVSATGLLGAFNQAGVLLAPDVHVAQTLGRLCGEGDEQVLLAAALAVRALRLGSVCLELTGVRERAVAEMHDPALQAGDGSTDVAALPWPEEQAWLERLGRSPMVAQGPEEPTNSHPLRLVADLLYLERYWAEESVVRARLDERAAQPSPLINEAALEPSLGRLFTGEKLDAGEADRQREAAGHAARNWTTVVAGGPGTGKTTTIAKLLAVLQEVSPSSLRVALAAPSGKAAARLQEAVSDELAKLPAGTEVPRIAPASTLHKLLDARGAGRGFGRGPANPLPQEVVVVDEVSMVALPLMARLLEALRPDTRLVLVGDPHQLTSVDAGAVLADLVRSGGRAGEPPTAPSVEAPPAPSPSSPAGGRAARASVTELTHIWRFGEQIKALAQAIRVGDAEQAVALLEAGDSAVELVAADAGGLQLTDLDEVARQVVTNGRLVFEAARSQDVAAALAALDGHRLLCAHREGRWGVARWGRMAEDLLRSEVDGYGAGDDAPARGEWYVGRPLLVTQNLRDLGLSNGDSGVVVATGQGLRAAVGTPTQWRMLSPFLLDAVTSLHAMTVHKAQGSQFKEVTVVLPPPESALLTRELLYTAVTRARDKVRLVGDPQAVRKAIETEAVRASGLARGW